MRVLKNGYDITDFVTSVKWSGDIKSGIRKVTVSYIFDNNFEMTYIKPGDMIHCIKDQQVFFKGMVYDSDFSSKSKQGSITCYDQLKRLTKNEITKKYANIKAYQMLNDICRGYDLKVQDNGHLDTSENRVVFNKKEIEILNMLLEERNLFCRIENDTLKVYEQGEIKASKALFSDEVILDSKYSESISEMINHIIYINESDQIIKENINDNIKKYGTFNQIKKVKNLSEIDVENDLKDLAVKFSANTMKGYLDCLSGNFVEVVDQVSNQRGLFLIERDDHTFKDGHHTMQLEFKKVGAHG